MGPEVETPGRHFVALAPLNFRDFLLKHKVMIHFHFDTDSKDEKDAWLAVYTNALVLQRSVYNLLNKYYPGEEKQRSEEFNEHFDYVLSLIESYYEVLETNSNSSTRL